MLKMKTKKSTSGETRTTGKRKRALAKAIIKEGTGKILINKKPYTNLPKLRRMMIQEPIELTKEALGKFNFDISIVVKGGGQASQVEASRLAIARAIIGFTKSSELKKKFVDYDRNLLIADVRRKEAYKPGDSKARRKRQKSYR